MQSSANELVSNIMCREKQRSCLCCWSLIFYLSSSFCGEALGLFVLGGSFLQLPTGNHLRSRACWYHTGMPGISACPLPKRVKVQLFKDSSSTRGPSLSLYFSSYSGKSQWWPSVVSPSSIFSPFAPCPILLLEHLFSFGNFPFPTYGPHSLPLPPPSSLSAPEPPPQLCDHSDPDWPIRFLHCSRHRKCFRSRHIT